MNDLTKIYSEIILKDIIKSIDKINKRIALNTQKLSDYGLCDGSSRYWKMVHNHDILVGELNLMYERLYELDKITDWYNLKDSQLRYEFLLNKKEILERYELLYNKNK